jgi:hypothetical protein
MVNVAGLAPVLNALSPSLTQVLSFTVRKMSLARWMGSQSASRAKASERGQQQQQSPIASAMSLVHVNTLFSEQPSI